MKGKQPTGLPSRHPLIQLPQRRSILGLFHSPYLRSHCSLHLEHWSHCLKGCVLQQAFPRPSLRPLSLP